MDEYYQTGGGVNPTEAAAIAASQQETDPEDMEDIYDVPSVKPSESLYELFNKVLKLKDNSKVGNLDKIELGQLDISVRDCQKIAVLAEQFRHEKFARFFRNQGEIILTTSASKKGWFVELFVSQKKFTQRASTTQIGSPSEKKWNPFGKKNKVSEDVAV